MFRQIPSVYTHHNIGTMHINPMVHENLYEKIQLREDYQQMPWLRDSVAETRMSMTNVNKFRRTSKSKNMLKNEHKFRKTSKSRKSWKVTNKTVKSFSRGIRAKTRKIPDSKSEFFPYSLFKKIMKD